MPFLGRVVMAANAVNSSTLIIKDVWRHLHVRCFIAGYSGAGIARLRVGGAAVDTGNNCANAILETATSNVTGVSIPGWPMGVTATTGARYATFDIFNVAAIVKRMTGKSNSISVAAATAPTRAELSGIWVNTSVPIQAIDIANYDTLTATAVSANTLTAGSEFYVWGHNDD